MENLRYERCLQFRFYNDDKARHLEEKLKAQDIDYVAYYDGLYILFKIRKPKGYTWNNIYAIINSIQSAKYSFVKTCIKDGQEYELICC